METTRAYACVICGEETPGHQPWFLVAANRWQDKLKILHWNEYLASQAGIQHVCSAGHVQQLVVHWMTTGSVDYPFARIATQPGRHPNHRRMPLSNPADADGHDVDTGGAHPIGELSVHRESMQRILRESPHSLTSILDALLGVLQHNQRSLEQELGSEEEELCGVGRQV